MKSTDLLTLPPGIRIRLIERRGYAASANPITALAQPGLTPCDRQVCPLRGKLAPRVHDTVAAMYAAAEIAIKKREAGVEPARGYLFHVRLQGRIAFPEPSLARAMARGEAGELWEILRPIAEEKRLQGISLPYGTVIFSTCRIEGCYREELKTILPAVELPGRRVR